MLRAILSILLLASAPVALAGLEAGGTAIATSASPIVVNGRTVGTLEPGQSVTVLGLQAATNQAIVSLELPGRPKLVGSVSADHLISVDGSPSVPAAPATATASPPPASTLDLSTTLPAVDVARFFKADKSAALAQYNGQRMKLSGIIDRVALDRGPGGMDIPTVYLRSAAGLPRLKIVFSNTLGSNDALFQRYSNVIPNWWWSYRDRSLDYRLAGLTEIQVRTTYRSSNTVQHSDGTSSVSRSRSNSQWFTLFKVGESISLEGTCSGCHLDIEFNGGTIL